MRGFPVEHSFAPGDLAAHPTQQVALVRTERRGGDELLVLTVNPRRAGSKLPSRHDERLPDQAGHQGPEPSGHHAELTHVDSDPFSVRSTTDC
jgi:hypothetical protein